MSWHFLQGQEVASWEGSSLAGAPSALSSLLPTPDPSCSPDSATVSCPASPCGTTSEPSTGDRGADTSMSSAAGSPAPTSASQGRVQGSTASSLDFGGKWLGSFARWDRATSSWKTPQCLLLGGLDEFSGTWPRWGTMRDGACWEVSQPAFVLTESACGLSHQAPTANDWRDCYFRIKSLIRPHHPNGNLKDQFAQGFGMRITPLFTEILMNWPEGWSDSRPSETAKFRQWCASHGEPSPVEQSG